MNIKEEVWISGHMFTLCGEEWTVRDEIHEISGILSRNDYLDTAPPVSEGHRVLRISVSVEVEEEGE